MNSWPRVAGVDAHAEDEVGAAATAATRLGLRLGIEGDADAEPVLAAARDRRGHVVDGLVVEGDAVAARRSRSAAKCARVVDHQVAVDDARQRVDERRDRLEHDRPHRDRRDEVAVADVEVEDPRAGRASSASICSPRWAKSAA